MGSRERLEKIEKLLHRGAYSEVLAETLDSAEGNVRDGEVATVVAALGFSGRIEEAEALFRLRSGRLDAAAVSACRFHLGISFCRHSLYGRSREYLVAGLLQGRKSRSPVVRFYAFQGLGFYRFYSARYRSSVKAARLAADAALEAGFLWGRLLSTDLLGHSLVQRGSVSQGLALLQEAHRMASRLGDGGLGQAIEVSLTCYQAQFGLEPRRAIPRLRALARQLRTQDTYSRSSLCLELGRQYALRGRLHEAREALNESCRFIYASRNRRQGVVLSLRYAQLHALQGEREQALNGVRAAMKELDPYADRALEVEVLGLECRLLRSMGGMESEARALEDRVRALTLRTEKSVSGRMLKRAPRSRIEGSADVRGEDPLGDLLDRGDLEEVLGGPYLGLVPELLGVDRAERTLVLDVLPGALLVVDRGSVLYRPEGLSALFRRLLLVLAPGRELAKGELIRQVWGYAYRPLAHDQLVYSTFSRLRLLLGAHADWILLSESGYRLAPDIRVRDGGPVPVPVLRGVSEPAQPDAPELGLRQLRILKGLEKTRSVTTREVRDRHRVSEITASRDLSLLYSLGLIKKLGKGRATCYVLPHDRHDAPGS